jgi:hypothetical protein
MKPKASDLLRAALGYDSAMWAPNYSEVHFGCDCGCGGDGYDPEEWDELCNGADQDVADFYKLCKSSDIEWDLIEVQKIKL